MCTLDSLVELLSFMQGTGWALYDLTDLGHYSSDATHYQYYASESVRKSIADLVRRG